MHPSIPPKCPLVLQIFQDKQEMKAVIAIALFGTIAFAATISDECEPDCMKNCMELGEGETPNALLDQVPWHRGGDDHLGTCQESCDNMCQVTDDRFDDYGNFGGGRELILCIPEAEGQGSDSQGADGSGRGRGNRRSYCYHIMATAVRKQVV